MDRVTVDCADEEIVREYIGFRMTREEQNDDDDYSALYVIDELIHDHPDRAWRILCRLCDAAPLSLVPDIGIRDLENFMHLHGDRFVAEIEEQARSSERFRLALANVWLPRNLFSPQISERLVEASGGELTLLEMNDRT